MEEYRLLEVLVDEEDCGKLNRMIIEEGMDSTFWTQWLKRMGRLRMCMFVGRDCVEGIFSFFLSFFRSFFCFAFASVHLHLPVVLL